MTDKKLYETASLAISMLPCNDLSAEEIRMKQILEDYLPYYWIEDDRVYATVAILTDKGPEKWTAYSDRAQEVQELVRQIENSHTDDEWENAMFDFGALCLEQLQAIYSENLCES